MKKVVNFVYYMMVATLSTLIVMLLLVGCESGTGDDSNLPDYVYLTDVTPFSLPEGIEWITNITVANDSVYFAAFAEYDDNVPWDGFTVELETLKQEDVDKITNMINSVSSTVGQDDAIWNIISESAANYFNGQASIQDTVRIIQNRATTYISEQS